jgi:hypothetical protein
MPPFLSVLIAILLFAIVCLLFHLSLILGQVCTTMKKAETVNPLFPVFDLNTVFQSKVAFVKAEETYEEAEDELDDFPNRRNAYSHALADFEFEREHFRQLFEGNIAALNGKPIAEVRNEYSEWMASRYPSVLQNRNGNK